MDGQSLQKAGGRNTTTRWMGRGMGSPIPSPQEGAWVREDPKVVGGGQFRLSVDPFDLEP